jgi:hypothetical protein
MDIEHISVSSDLLRLTHQLLQEGGWLWCRGLDQSCDNGTLGIWPELKGCLKETVS